MLGLVFISPLSVSEVELFQATASGSRIMKWQLTLSQLTPRSEVIRAFPNAQCLKSIEDLWLQTGKSQLHLPSLGYCLPSVLHRVTCILCNLHILTHPAATINGSDEEGADALPIQWPATQSSSVSPAQGKPTSFARRTYPGMTGALDARSIKQPELTPGFWGRCPSCHEIAEGAARGPAGPKTLSALPPPE